MALRAEALGIAPVEPEHGAPADFLERLLPGARYVRILRQDVHRQAVSFWTAFVTGVWTRFEGDKREPVRDPFYSFEGIESCRRAIESFEVHLDRFLRANGIDAMTVVYEQLVEDWEGTMRAVLRHLRPEVEVEDVAPPTVHRQSSELTDAMVERYVRESRLRPLPDPREIAELGDRARP